MQFYLTSLQYIVAELQTNRAYFLEVVDAF